MDDSSRGTPVLPQGDQAVLEVADEILPAVQCKVFLFSAGIIVCCIHLGSVVQSSRRGLNSLRSYTEGSKGNIFPASKAWLTGSEHVCLPSV